MKYKNYLKTDHWKRLARSAKQEAGDRCQLCNAAGELHAHHRTYERIGRELPEDLICLCSDCHAKFHNKDKKPDVDFADDLTGVEILISDVKSNLIDCDFEGWEYFDYWESFVLQHAAIYKESNDNRFEETAKKACVTNTSLAIQEAFWNSNKDVEIKNKMRDLSFLPERAGVEE